MAHYTIKVNRPNQIGMDIDDGTVTISVHHGNDTDTFTVDCATDELAFDLISNIGSARAAKTWTERDRMERDLTGDHWSIPKITRVVRELS